MILLLLLPNPKQHAPWKQKDLAMGGEMNKKQAILVYHL